MSKMSENAFNDLPHDGLPSDGTIEARARVIFRSAVEGTDSYHALRLGLARRKALNARGAHTGLRVWAPLAGAAACCALVAGVVMMRPVTRLAPAAGIATSAPIAAGQADEDETLPEVGSAQMEVVQNLDFYRWLATQPGEPSTSSGSEH